MAIPVQNVRFAGPPGHAGQQHARQPTDGAGSAGVRGAHRRCAQTAEASELVHGSAHIRGVRQRREGAVACVLALCLIGHPMAVRTQNCPHDYIAWPREQCTQRCPAAFKCSYDASRTVTRYQADYCCLCVSDGQGNYEAFMCAGSAKPRPAGRQVPCRAPADHSRRGKQGRRWTDKAACAVQVPYNATISDQQRAVTVHVPSGGAVLTSYVHLSADLLRNWGQDPFTYLEVEVGKFYTVSALAHLLDKFTAC